MKRTNLTRDQQVDKATQEAYYASRRPRPAKILQVPSVSRDYWEPGFKTGPMRPVIVPFKPTPITWREARLRGEAFGRVMIGDPWGKYPPAEVMAKRRERNLMRTEARQMGTYKSKAKPHRKDGRGEWWLNKLADLIDQRADIKVPAYSRRARELAPTQVDTAE